jgi:quercetin dioxygenase-like cupin family protein
MFQYIAQADDKPWQPGPYNGVELKLLHKDEVTGAVTVLRKFAAGAIIPAHSHPLANEWAYVLSGEWEEAEKFILRGRCSTLPKGNGTARIRPKPR